MFPLEATTHRDFPKTRISPAGARFGVVIGRPAAKGGQLGGSGDASLNAAENDFPIEI